MSTFEDNVEPSDDLLERVNQWFQRGDLSEYVRLHEGQIEYERRLSQYLGCSDFALLMCCCSDNIVEVDGVDVIDFDAVRADFESAKKEDADDNEYWLRQHRPPTHPALGMWILRVVFAIVKSIRRRMKKENR